jgi:hypothetical protein
MDKRAKQWEKSQITVLYIIRADGKLFGKIQKASLSGTPVQICSESGLTDLRTIAKHILQYADLQKTPVEKHDKNAQDKTYMAQPFFWTSTESYV